MSTNGTTPADAAEAEDLARRTADARARVLVTAAGLDIEIRKLAPSVRAVADAIAAFTALAGKGPSWVAHGEMGDPNLLAAAIGKLAAWHAAEGAGVRPPRAEMGDAWYDPEPLAVLLAWPLGAWDSEAAPPGGPPAAVEGPPAPEPPHGVLGPAATLAPSHGLASTSWPSRAPPRPDEVATAAAENLT